MKKYSIQQIQNNLIQLQNKLNNKKRNNGFWVIATRNDFRPLKKKINLKDKESNETVIKISDIRDYLIYGKEKYFIDKKFAFINFNIDEEIINMSPIQIEKNYNKLKNEFVCNLIIQIYKVDANGKIGNQTQKNNFWTCIINFTLEDLENFNIKYRDAEIFMRQVADKIVLSNNPIGISYKNYIKSIKKNYHN